MIRPTKEQLRDLRKNYGLFLQQKTLRQNMSVSTVLNHYEYVRANQCQYLPSKNGGPNVSYYFCDVCKIECCKVKQQKTGDPIILEHS